jgi:hypothetical protein
MGRAGHDAIDDDFGHFARRIGGIPDRERQLLPELPPNSPP